MLLPPRTQNQASACPGSPQHFTDGVAKAQRGRLTCLKAHSSWEWSWDLNQTGQFLYLPSAPPGCLEGRTEGNELRGTDRHTGEHLATFCSPSGYNIWIHVDQWVSLQQPHHPFSQPCLCSESSLTPLLPQTPLQTHRPPGCFQNRDQQTAANRPHPTHSPC